MCRFVAVISKKPFETAEYINMLKHQARYGKRAPHKDGWGAYIRKENGDILHKETVPVWLSSATFPRSYILMAHARKKGRGAKVAICNTHPFVCGDAVFMHNGVIKIVKHPLAKGDTDSESAFLTLLSSDLDEFKKRLKTFAETHEYRALNFVMLYDAKLIVVRSANANADYYSIYFKREGDKIVISTELEHGEAMKNHTGMVIDENLNLWKWNIFSDTLH